MHDLLEGALQYEVNLMLRKFILDDGYFTLEHLNGKLENMELGYMESKYYLYYFRPSRLTIFPFITIVPRAPVYTS